MLQMFCYFVISRGWRYKRRGIILAFDVLLWGITFGYSMLCWRLPRHKSFCSKENSSRLLPTAGVNIAKGTRSRNQLIDFFHWIVLINYKWCTTLKQTAWIKRQVSSGESCNSTLRNFILRTFIIKTFCKKISVDRFELPVMMPNDDDFFGKSWKILPYGRMSPNFILFIFQSDTECNFRCSVGNARLCCHIHQLPSQQGNISYLAEIIPK